VGHDNIMKATALAEIRRKLEEVAEEFGDGSQWCWDRTRMHLTISDPKGAPIATLHVEQVN
jgi:hypothetical protein